MTTQVSVGHLQSWKGFPFSALERKKFEANNLEG